MIHHLPPGRWLILIACAAVAVILIIRNPGETPFTFKGAVKGAVAVGLMGTWWFHSWKAGGLFAGLVLVMAAIGAALKP
jgi:hypothetical protein